MKKFILYSFLFLSLINIAYADCVPDTYQNIDCGSFPTYKLYTSNCKVTNTACWIKTYNASTRSDNILPMSACSNTCDTANGYIKVGCQVGNSNACYSVEDRDYYYTIKPICKKRGSYEKCGNGIDDDCDSQIDEQCSGWVGVQSCAADTEWHTEWTQTQSTGQFSSMYEINQYVLKCGTTLIENYQNWGGSYVMPSSQTVPSLGTYLGVYPYYTNAQYPQSWDVPFDQSKCKKFKVNFRANYDSAGYDALHPGDWPIGEYYLARNLINNPTRHNFTLAEYNNPDGRVCVTACGNKLYLEINTINDYISSIYDIVGDYSSHTGGSLWDLYCLRCDDTKWLSNGQGDIPLINGVTPGRCCEGTATFNNPGTDNSCCYNGNVYADGLKINGQECINGNWTTCNDLDNDGYFNLAECGTIKDCNDNDNTIYPGNTEICDNKDNNCNGQIDENAIDATFTCPLTGTKYCASAECTASCTQTATCAIASGSNAFSFYSTGDGAWRNITLFKLGTDWQSLRVNGTLSISHQSIGAVSSAFNYYWNGVQVYEFPDIQSGTAGSAYYGIPVVYFNYLIPALSKNYIPDAYNQMWVTNVQRLNDGNLYLVLSHASRIASRLHSVNYKWTTASCPLGNNLACSGTPSKCTKITACTSICADVDNDGYYGQLGCGTAVDCNDNDNAINPSKTEICDGKDNNCNSQTDEGLVAPLNTKQSGVCAGSRQICSGLIGWQDNYIAIPTYSITEICNDNLDNDCNNQIDEGCLTCTVGSSCDAAVIYGGQSFNCSGTYDNSCNCMDIFNDECPEPAPNCLNQPCVLGNNCTGIMDALCNCYDLANDGCPILPDAINCGNGHREPDMGEECDRNDMGFTKCSDYTLKPFGTINCNHDCEYFGCYAECKPSISDIKCANLCGNTNLRWTPNNGASCYKDDKCMMPCGEMTNVTINADNVVTQRKIVLYNGKPVTVNIFSWN